MTTQPNSDRELAEKILEGSTSVDAITEKITQHLSPERDAKDAEIQQLKAIIVMKDETLIGIKHELLDEEVCASTQVFINIIDKALSTNPGSQLLEELERLRQQPHVLELQSLDRVIADQEKELAELRKDKERVYVLLDPTSHVRAVHMRYDGNEDYILSREQLDAAITEKVVGKEGE